MFLIFSGAFGHFISDYFELHSRCGMKLLCWLPDITEEKSIPAVSKMGQLSKNSISDVVDILDLSLITEMFASQNWVLINLTPMFPWLWEISQIIWIILKPPWGEAINCKLFSPKSFNITDVWQSYIYASQFFFKIMAFDRHLC